MTSKHFAVVGDPIDHSLSPNIHSVAYRFLGLDWDYTRFQISEGYLQTFLSSEGSNLSGLSVTMPLKHEASELAASRDEIVELLGVANTLVRTESGFAAFNTDVYGIEMSLSDCWKANIDRVAVLGSGATAQSALFALHRKVPKAQISIYVRDLAKTQSIKDLASKLGLDLEIRELSTFSTNQDLTISTIPATALDTISTDSQHGWLLNVNYSSKDSNFSSQFDDARVIQGETMLIWQAIAQIRIFISGSPNIELGNEEAVFANMADAL